MALPVNIKVYTFCYNSEKILPFIINYWKQYATSVVVYDNMSTDKSVEILSKYDWIEVRHFDTNKKHDPDKMMQIKNNCVNESKSSKADYVMICDLDEVLYCYDSLMHDLAIAKQNGIKVFNSVYYNAIVNKFPASSLTLLQNISGVKLVKNINVNKVLLFDPSINIKFSNLQNNCTYDNNIKTGEINIIYNKMIGLDRFLNEQLDYIKRINKTNKYAMTYGASKNSCVAIFNNIYAKSFQPLYKAINQRIVLNNCKLPVLKTESKQVQTSNIIPETKNSTFNFTDIKWKPAKIQYNTPACGNKDLVIVIPVYKADLDKYEQMSLQRLSLVIKTSFDIVLVMPEGLNIESYNNIYPGKINTLALNKQYFCNRKGYSYLCETTLFYECFSDYKFMLIYQLDGWIFKNDLNRFIKMDYDYIGAPWKQSLAIPRTVGNGGVSLRKISKFIEICKWLDPKDINEKYAAQIEDIFFCLYVKKKLKDKFNIAPVNVGLDFCIDKNPTYWMSESKGKLPMCVHAFQKHYSYWEDKFNNADIKQEVKKAEPKDLTKIGNKNIKSPEELKIALCAIAKNENKYIREWVEYYKSIGITKIYLYDNNDKDGEHFEDVINDYILSNYVKVINKRGVEKGLVYNADGVNLLPICYCDCYETYGKYYDWMCFFDIDEFLSLKTKNILHFLYNSKFNNFDTVLVVWLMYNDNGHIRYENKKVQERFTQVSKYQNYGVKSICRCSKRILNKKQENLIHRFTLEGKNICYCNGITDTFKVTDWSTNLNIYKSLDVYLKHYNTKTIEEYMQRHVGRHWGTGKKNSTNVRSISEILQNFKKHNDLTTDKKQFIINYTGKKYNNEKGVISLTSWSKRIENAYKTIESLLNNCKDFHIVLVLSSDEFKNKNKDLPVQLLSLILNDKIEILWVKKNYKAFKKILFTMKKYKNVPIISADDDLIYIEDYATKLYNIWQEHPECGHITSHHSKMKCGCGACSLYAPYSMYNACDIISDEIIDTYEDDFFYQFLLTKFGVKQYYVNNYWPWKLHSSNAAMSDIYKKEDIASRIERYNKAYNKLDLSKIDSFKPIVSFTSYAPRLLYCAKVIQSILNNTLKPYKIVLTLYKDDAKLVSQYTELLQYINDKKIELIISDIDLKSHKKYFYTMQKYRNNPIITIDDDSIYPPDFILSFRDYYYKYPNCVLGRRTHRKKYNSMSELLLYKQWEFECKSILVPTSELMCIGVGGVLYPPNILNITDDNLKEIYDCITVDDIYLHYLELKKNIKIVYVKNNKNLPPTISGSEKTAMWSHINCVGSDTPNDIAIKKLLKSKI